MIFAGTAGTCPLQLTGPNHVLSLYQALQPRFLSSRPYSLSQRSVRINTNILIILCTSFSLPPLLTSVLSNLLVVISLSVCPSFTSQPAGYIFFLSFPSFLPQPHSSSCFLITRRLFLIPALSGPDPQSAIHPHLYSGLHFYHSLPTLNLDSLFLYFILSLAHAVSLSLSLSRLPLALALSPGSAQL